jgi:hypothetical protein
VEQAYQNANRDAFFSTESQPSQLPQLNRQLVQSFTIYAMTSLLSSATRRLSSITSQLSPSRKASTMKEAVISKGPKVSIIDSPIPKPGPHQLVTKVVYSGSNPKDWKVPGTPTGLSIID